MNSKDARLRRRLLQRKNGLDAVHGDAAEELGVEVGGFLRHDFVGGGDLYHFFDVHGIQEEGDLGAAGINGGDGCGSFAFVGEVHFLGGGLQSDTEGGFEDAVVEKDDIQFALQWRDAREKLAEVGARAQLKKIKGALGSRCGGVGTDGAVRGGGGEAGEKFFAG